MISGKPFKVDLHGNPLDKGDILICPVCGDSFPVGDDTNYICCGGYVCSWKCFLKNNKEVEERKKLERAAMEANGIVYIDEKQKRRRKKDV